MELTRLREPSQNHKLFKGLAEGDKAVNYKY